MISKVMSYVCQIRSSPENRFIRNNQPEMGIVSVYPCKDFLMVERLDRTRTHHCLNLESALTFNPKIDALDFIHVPILIHFTGLVCLEMEHCILVGFLNPLCKVRLERQCRCIFVAALELW